MRRADRLFDIIQALRTAKGPVTAETLAKHLEVTVRTVYRDVATLQARRVPIEGAAGIGYMLRRGFDLPPLMFSTEEIEAIAVAMRGYGRTFCTRTITASAATQSRFITPAVNSNSINAQQQPTQKVPCDSPMRNAPATPGRQWEVINSIGLLHCVRQRFFSGENS